MVNVLSVLGREQIRRLGLGPIEEEILEETVPPTPPPVEPDAMTFEELELELEPTDFGLRITPEFIEAHPEVDVPEGDWFVVQDVESDLGFTVTQPPPEVELDITEPTRFGVEEAREFGVELPEGWEVEVTPTEPIEAQPEIGMPAMPAGFSTELITPEGMRITEAGFLITPEGERFSPQQIATMQKWDKLYTAIDVVVGSDKYGSRAPIFTKYLDEGDIPNFITELIQEAGPRNREQVDQLFRMLQEVIPGLPLKEEYFDKFWAYLERGELTSTRVREYLSRKQQGFWEQVKEDVLSTGLGAFQQWVAMPWEMGALEVKAKFDLYVLGRNKDLNRATIDRIEAMRDLYGGAAALGMPEYKEIYEDYLKETRGFEWFAGEAIPWVNPAYLIPIGGTGFSVFGVPAKITERIPLIGKSLERTAVGVQAVEKGIAFPIEKGFKGLEKVGAKIEAKVADRLIKKSGTLDRLVDIPIGQEGMIKDIEGALVDNWQKSALQKLAKVPPAKKFIEQTLGWRILTKREGGLIEDLVGRGAVGWTVSMRRGINAAAIKVMELRSIISNPVRTFGFSEGFSEKMAGRLLPEHAADREIAGTLEHVFTQPQKYNWSGIARGEEYVAKIAETNELMLNLLKAEGVNPEHVVQDWIHRVVEDTGKKGTPPLKRGVAVGAKPGFEKRRKFETMADGIKWFSENPQYGKQYSSNPELAVSDYLKQAFKKIADKRLETYVEGYGISPAEILAGRQPELIAEAKLTADQLASSARFESELNQAIRQAEKGQSYITASATMAKLEREFGVKALQFKSLAQDPVTINPINQYLAGTRKTLPTSARMKETFEAMPYPERLTYRANAENMVAATGDKGAKRMLHVLDEVDGVAKFIPTPEIVEPTVSKIERVTRTIKPGRSQPPYEDTVTLINGKYRIHSNAVSKGAPTDVYAHSKIWVVRDDVTEEVIKGGFATQKEALEYAKQLIPEKGKIIPTAEPFGYPPPVPPSGKATATTLSREEYVKLVELHEKAGLPPPEVAVRHKIEGVRGLEEEVAASSVRYEVPKGKSATQRKPELTALRDEMKALKEAQKGPYWRARSKKAEELAKIRQGEIGKGYIMQPFASGKIYDQEFINAFNKFFGYDKGLGVLKVTSDVAGILRITKAALDLSAMAIQGLPSFGLAHSYLITNPAVGTKLMGAWYHAFFQSTRAFFQPSVANAYMRKNLDMSMQRAVSFGGSVRTVDYFGILEAERGLGGLAARGMRKIPLHPYERAESSFFLAGEMVRDEFWRILSADAIKRGQGHELARILDRITGIISPEDLGVPLLTRQIEQSFTWFAPSYTRACLTVVGDIFRGGYTGAQARRAIGGLVGAGAVYYGGAQYSAAKLDGKSDEEAWRLVLRGFGVTQDAITGEYSWSPTSAMFTLQIGDQSLPGPRGFWYGLTRLAGDINDAVDEKGLGAIISIVDIRKGRDAAFVDWWYNRAATTFGTGMELGTGKDYFGYPFETPADYAKHIATRFEPIWMEQGINYLIPGMAKEHEIPKDNVDAAIKAGGEFFGLGSRWVGAWSNFYDVTQEAIKQIPEDVLREHYSEEELPQILDLQEEGRLEWKHLPESLQQNLMRGYPDVREAWEDAVVDSNLKDTGEWGQWSGAKDQIQATHIKQTAYLGDEVEAGDLDTREYRESISDLGRTYGGGLVALEAAFPELYELLNAKNEDHPEYGWLSDVSLFEYNAVRFKDYTDEKGDMDWDAKDEDIANYIEKWGMDDYERNRKFWADDKRDKGYSEKFIQLAEDKDKLGREYWDLPYRQIIDMDEDDVVEGNIPDEHIREWRQYHKLETDEEREAFLKANPELDKDWRAEYRKSHPEEDAMLALWGYGGKLQSMAAYDILSKRSSELGIPMAQMGLGLPPRRLVGNYFDYNELSSKGYDRKWYRLENPEWDAWGQATFGWQPINTDTLPSREVGPLLIEYRAIEGRDKAANDARLKLRIENPALDEYLIDILGYKSLAGKRAEELPPPKPIPMHLLSTEELINILQGEPARDWWEGIMWKFGGGVMAGNDGNRILAQYGATPEEIERLLAFIGSTYKGRTIESLDQLVALVQQLSREGKTIAAIIKALGGVTEETVEAPTVPPEPQEFFRTETPTPTLTGAGARFREETGELPPR